MLGDSDAKPCSPQDSLKKWVSNITEYKDYLKKGKGILCFNLAWERSKVQEEPVGSWQLNSEKSGEEQAGEEQAEREGGEKGKEGGGRGEKGGGRERETDIVHVSGIKAVLGLEISSSQ